MGEQIVVLSVLVGLVAAAIIGQAMSDRRIEKLAQAAFKDARDQRERDGRTITSLAETINANNVVLRGISSEAMDKFWLYDPNAREMKRIELETRAMELQLSDTRARYRNGQPAAHAGANGMAAAKSAPKTAERFSDTGGDTL